MAVLKSLPVCFPKKNAKTFFCPTQSCAKFSRRSQKKLSRHSFVRRPPHAAWFFCNFFYGERVREKCVIKSNKVTQGLFVPRKAAQSFSRRSQRKISRHSFARRPPHAAWFFCNFFYGERVRKKCVIKSNKGTQGFLSHAKLRKVFRGDRRKSFPGTVLPEGHLMRLDFF